MILLIPGREYRISYRDNEGVPSLRTIRVISTWTSWGEEYVRAWCTLRHDERTFRRDRIFSAEPVRPDSDNTRPRSSSAAPVSPEPERPMRVVSPDGEPDGDSASVLCNTSTAPRKSGAFAGFVIVFLTLTVSLAALSGTPKPVIPVQRTVTALPKKSVPAVNMEQWRSHTGLLASRFRLETGISSPGLEDYYARADLNFDRVLSWQEIEIFQSKIDRSFSYRHNDTALPPDQFFALKGGDCEDWSLFSCGLLTFWGYTCYIGVVDGSDGGTARHAIALFYKRTRPANWRYSYYYFQDPVRINGTDLPAGYYLPIDYAYTGTFSSATRAGSPLRYVYTPVSIYNRRM